MHLLMDGYHLPHLVHAKLTDSDGGRIAMLMQLTGTQWQVTTHTPYQVRKILRKRPWRSLWCRIPSISTHPTYVCAEHTRSTDYQLESLKAPTHLEFTFVSILASCDIHWLWDGYTTSISCGVPKSLFAFESYPGDLVIRLCLIFRFIVSSCVSVSPLWILLPLAARSEVKRQ